MCGSIGRSVCRMKVLGREGARNVEGKRCGIWKEWDVAREAGSVWGRIGG